MYYDLDLSLINLTYLLTYNIILEKINDAKFKDTWITDQNEFF